MPKVGKNIRKRKDGRWEGRFKTGIKNGKTVYHSVYGKTYADVKEQLFKASQKNSFPTQKHTNVLFSESLELWLQNRSVSLKRSTFMKYENLITTHIMPDLGKMKTDSITEAEINRFILKKPPTEDLMHPEAWHHHISEQW